MVKIRRNDTACLVPLKYQEKKINMMLAFCLCPVLFFLFPWPEAPAGLAPTALAAYWPGRDEHWPWELKETWLAWSTLQSHPLLQRRVSFWENLAGQHRQGARWTLSCARSPGSRALSGADALLSWVPTTSIFVCRFVRIMIGQDWLFWPVYAMFSPALPTNMVQRLWGQLFTDHFLETIWESKFWLQWRRLERRTSSLTSHIVLGGLVSVDCAHITA